MTTKWSAVRASKGAPEPTHWHRYGLVPVWNADQTAIDSWWWCTDHEPGKWARIEDDPMAATIIPGWKVEYPETKLV